MLNYRVVRSYRKTLGLTINRQGELIVRSPHGASPQDIDRLLELKSGWIEAKLQEMAKLRATELRAEVGERVLLGRRLRIAFASIESPRLDSQEIQFPARWSHGQIVQYERQLLARLCEREIEAGIADLRPLFPDREPWPSGAFSLRKMKRRWGSCSAQGELIFNSRLSEAAPEAVRYVVRHELTHWVHFNHSPAFRKLEQQLVGGRERLQAAQAELARVPLD